MSTTVMFETPRREAPLSLELQRVIEERNVLSTRSKNKVINALNEIHAQEDLHRSLRSKAIHEILSSELSYVKQLETIMKYFMEPISNRNLMTPEQFTTIFGQVGTVYRVAEALVTELQKCREDSLAPAFIRLAPFLKMYSLYACGYNRAMCTLQELRSSKAGAPLHSFLQAQESRPEVSCSLQSLLITPVQRLPRYRLLLKEVATHTSPTNPQQRELKAALNGIESSAAHVDSLLSIQDQQQKLVNLQQMLCHGWPQVLSPGRSFITEGSFLKVSKCGTKAVPVHLVLLTDMFLCCNTKFGMLDCRYAFPLARCSLETVLGQAVFKVLCGTETLLLFAKNQDEGEAWTKAMKEAIKEVQSAQLTLRKQNSRKRIPKRLEDLEENLLSMNSGSFISRTLRKRKQAQSTSPQAHSSKKKQRCSKMLSSPLSSPRDSLYPLRQSLRTSGTPTQPFIRRFRRSPPTSNTQTQENDTTIMDANSNDAAPVNQDGTSTNSSWSSQCVELVRHVAQCIKSAFLNL
ncbi:hypothetical protein B566_EDAN016930 [Ephemera danica]|nr:hypothetical protein B566_EDAN016930 [Ephemera danica]